MNRSRQAIKNYAMSIGMAILTTLTGFIATPYLLAWLGETRWGAYRSLFEIVGLFQILDFGLTTAVVIPLAREIANHDTDKQREIIRKGMRDYSKVAALGIAIGLLLLLGLRFLIPVGEQYISEVRWAYLILILAQLFLLTQPFRIFLEAQQRGYLISLIIGIQNLLATAGAILLVALGYGLPGQAFAYVVSMGLSGLGYLALFGRYGPKIPLQFWKGSVSSEVSIQARDLRKPAFIVNLCGRFSLTIDTLIVSAMIAPAAVVPFFVTQRLVTAVNAQLQAIPTALWPGMIHLYHQNEQDRFQCRLVQLTRLMSCLSVSSLLPVVVWNERFINMWVGKEHYAGHVFNAVVFLNGLLVCMIVTWGMIIRGTGLIETLVPIYTTQAVMNVIFSVVLTYYLGVIGPVLGTLISFIAVTIWQVPRVLSTSMNIPIGQLISGLLIPFGIGLLQWLLWSVLTRSLILQNWFELLGMMAMTGMVSLLLMYWLGLHRDDRAELNRQFHNNIRPAFRI